MNWKGRELPNSIYRMKRCRFPVLLLLALVMTAVSCHKDDGRFILNGFYTPKGSVQTDSMILVTGIDSRFDRTDTIFPADGSFTWSFIPDTVTPLILIFPNGITQAVFADKGLTSRITIPDSGSIVIGGGNYNDAYQSFKEKVHDGITRIQITEMIDSFIKADPFSEVTPMLLYEYMIRKYHADRKDLEPLIKKMSGNMQDCPFIMNLKTKFGTESTGNNYITPTNLVDTLLLSKPFSDIAKNQHLLVCVWASWDERSNEARKELTRLKELYTDRNFTIADISIDTNIRRWKAAVSNDTLDWVSYCDPEGWNSRIIQDGQVQELPVYILFSGLKRIILKTADLTEMDLTLESELALLKKSEKITPRKFRITGM